MDETKPLIVNQTKEKTSGGIREAAVIKNVSLSIIILLSTCASDIGGQANSQYIVNFTKSQFTTNETSLSQNQRILNSTNACGHNETKKEENKGQKLAAHFNWYVSLIECSLSLPVILVVGVYSDKIGRKPLLMLSTVSSFLQYAIKAYLIYMKMHLYFFLVPAVIEGIVGKRYPFSLALAASVSDTTQRNHHRSLAFAILDALLGMGSFAAYLCSGYFIGSCGYFWPVFTSACLYFISIFILHTNVTETLKKDVPSATNTSSFLNHVFGFFYDSNRIKDNPKWKFILCFCIYIVMILASAVRSGIGTLYKMGYPLCWNSTKIGWYTASISFVHKTVGAFFLKVFQRCGRDDVVTMLGCLSASGYVTWEAFADVDWKLYVGAGVGFFSSMPFTLIRALMTLMVGDNDQGAFLTSYYAVDNIVVLSGSTMSNNIYAATEPIFRGFVYLISAGTYIVATILLIGLIASGGVVCNGKRSTKAK